MNSKFIIPIIITIVAIGIISITSFQESNVMEVEDVMNREIRPVEETLPEIQKKLDEIKKNVQESNNIESDYDPSREREWITSGPFQIDRNEYVLGEKIFLRINELSYEEKGQVAFLRPSNDTHYSVYLTIPFDGAKKSGFNYYLEPGLIKVREICSVEDLVGDWRVVFRGTNYSNLEFKIIEEILPGSEENFESVC